MGKVLNIRRDGRPHGAVYIGRGRRGEAAPFGNQHQIGRLNREQVVELYEKDLKKNVPLIQRIRKEIGDRDVVCFCAPALCHGHVITEVATMSEDALAAWKANPEASITRTAIRPDAPQGAFAFHARPKRFSR